jgi:proline dehydrogenase
MNTLLEIGAGALRKAALSAPAKEFILQNDVLFHTLKKAANRYIGGQTLEETIAKVVQQNQKGMKCSMEFMGENTLTAAEANEATQEFIRIAQQISQQQLHATISLDLSHIGLAVSQELGLRNLATICQAAKASNTEVIISAEGVEMTDQVLDAYKATQPAYDNLGITLQAYLHRTKDDLPDLLRLNGRIRLVKGAFSTPVGRSIPRGARLDDTYLGYVDQLLAARHRCSIATHHYLIQQAAKALIERYQPRRELYEFESLYGIRNEQLLALKQEGHPGKIYFVYGKEWYLYLCNRLAEYPLNVFLALNDLVESID